MRRLVVILVSFVVGCSSPGENSNVDAGLEDAAVDAGCEQFASQGCFQDSVYWFDSCGEPLELVEECVGDLLCDPEATSCCSRAANGQAVPLGASTVVAQFNGVFEQGGTGFEMVWTVHDDPGDQVGYWWYAILRVDGKAIWLGPQTSIGTAPVPGKGFLLTMFDTAPTEADARIGPGGFIENNGGAVGPRLVYPWTTGTYTLRFARAEAAGAADWFDLTVQGASDATPTAIGGVRVTRSVPEVPATLATSIEATLLVYTPFAGTTYGDWPRMSFDAAVSIDGTGFSELMSSYPGVEFANSEARLNNDALYVSFGGDTFRCTAEGPLVGAP